jgi:adenylate cyclase
MAGRLLRPGAEVVAVSADHSFADSPEYKNSPLAIVFGEAREVRYRLDDPETKRFPFFDDMRAEGVTDYIALPLLTTAGFTHASSWSTKHASGFSDAQLNALRSLMPPLTRLVEITNLRRTAAMLLDTYVGNRAGEKILGGQIRRGHTDTMVDILNQYFDCQVHSIRTHGGEVLKFMGDGLLAVFPVTEQDGSVQQVCSRALEAARESRAGVDAMQYLVGEALERFRFGVALHVGKVLYGNIGGGNRLDFTCIGPAVNLAARLEKIAGRLHRTVVASEGFAGICAGGWTELGEFPIAGFSKAERVYGLADETPAG